ncbi:helix-turn-helix domain-containing protein [Mastigocladopsis repens]|uniref:helix-turn-helix domain-containing protein n=1 Tax=Mastigocladopsis repens TaxID=221287 RepID=UPI0002E2E024|nr:RodZ domain-containing protein [Mastigocladopsis repens]
MNWRRRKDKTESIPSIEQQRAQILADMGAQLWTIRLERGLSLEEMVVLTRIPRRLLQAIEEANLAELPEPVYTQGLIRQFADALGVNGAEFSSTFPIGTNRVSLKPGWKMTVMGQLRPVHLYVLYIFLIFCSVSGLSGLLNAATLQASRRQNNQKIETQSAAQPQLIQSQKAQFQVFSKSPNSINEIQQVQIGVTLKEKSWIRVVADGKIQYEGELPQGTQRTWMASEQLTVKAGNAGGVMVSVNKQQAQQLGEPGKVKEMTIAANTRF